MIAASRHFFSQLKKDEWDGRQTRILNWEISTPYPILNPTPLAPTLYLTP